MVEGRSGIPSILYKYIPINLIRQGVPRSLRAMQLSALNDEVEFNISPMGGMGADAGRFRAEVGEQLQMCLGFTM